MTTPISALHLMANLHDCAAPVLMTDAEALRSYCLQRVADANLTIVDDKFHQFNAGNGITGVVLLAESHLAIHTWPERGYVTLDVFVCNLHCDNNHKAEQLFIELISAFSPASQHTYRVNRD